MKTVIIAQPDRIYPLVNELSIARFVPDAVVAHQPVVFPEPIGCVGNTGFLLTGIRSSLLGLANTPALMESGLIDMTDSIGFDVSLDQFAVRIGKDISIVSSRNTDRAKFVQSAASSYRVLWLNYTGIAKLPEEGPYPDAEVLFTLQGSLNLETAELLVTATAPSLVSVSMSDMNDVLAYLSDIEIIGYTLNATRVNHNRQLKGTAE